MVGELVLLHGVDQYVDQPILVGILLKVCACAGIALLGGSSEYQCGDRQVSMVGKTTDSLNAAQASTTTPAT